MNFNILSKIDVHKILTGRKNAFINPDKYETITGYTSNMKVNMISLQ